MAPVQASTIDSQAKEEILRYPTVELIRRLFPDVRMRGRSVMCNPLRNEAHASLSCFVDGNGIPRWKDHATGETGDNIDFFRKTFPGIGYVDAVERLSNMLLGRSALGAAGIRSREPLNFVRSPHRSPFSRSSALKVVSVSPLNPGTTERELVSYWRGRGISDEVIMRYCCRVEFENANRKGCRAVDPVSNLPILDDGGEPVVLDGRTVSLGMPNDIGGWSFRTPGSGDRKGFKGCDYSFVTVIGADGTFTPLSSVSQYGTGLGHVERLFYIERSGLLLINSGQGFSGVSPDAFRFVRPVLEGWTGRWLEGRELKGMAAMLAAFSRPLNDTAVVVEGMFDALSYIEYAHLGGLGPVPGADLVVLNSVSNIGWAVPFLSAHRHVLSFLDLDMRTGAGQKAFVKMRSLVEEHSAKTLSLCSVSDGSDRIYPYKDFNDFLMARRGFPVPPQDKIEVRPQAVSPGPAAGQAPAVAEDNKKRPAQQNYITPHI